MTLPDDSPLANLLNEISGALLVGDADDGKTMRELLVAVEEVETLSEGGPALQAVAQARDALRARMNDPNAADPFPSVETMVEVVRSPPSEAVDTMSQDGVFKRDPEMVELFGDFLQEAETGLDQADEILLAAEQGSADGEKINALFRVVHTIKGVAACLELADITKLAHATETILDHARQGDISLDGPRLERVFEGTSLLRTLLGGVRRAVDNERAITAEPAVVPLVEALQNVLLKAPDADAEETPGAEEAADAESDADEEPGHANDFVGAEAKSEKRTPGESAVMAVHAGAPRGKDDSAVRYSPASLTPATKRQQPKEVVTSATNAANERPPVATTGGAGAAKKTKTVEASPDAGMREEGSRKNDGTGKIKETVKVDLERVESVVEMIGELLIVESMVVNAPEIAAVSSLKVRNYLNQLTKISRDLQNVAMRMRMVPVRGVFQKMARMVRDLSKKTGKNVALVQSGESVEMDRSMVERIEDPLMHMIRNAVDHGIEPDPRDRIAAGKPASATVRLSAFHEGGSIVIEIADDGRGLSREAILRKARERGIVEGGAELSDSAVWELIFAPGFSTATQVTEISGRGVGMDVVKRSIEAMRGRVAISSTAGRGTTFRLVLPLTLAIIDGMLVACGTERYIVPSLSVIESLRPTASMIKTLAGSTELIDVRGEILPLFRLHRLFRVPGEELPATQAHAVVIETIGRKIALLVDDVITQQQVVIKALGAGMGDVEFLSGAAILADGRVGLILNVDKLGQLAPRRSFGRSSPNEDAAA